MNYKIIFAGTPDFAVPALQTLIDSEHTVCAVYSPPDRPAGRGRKLQASPVKQCALRAKIPVFQPTSLKSIEAQQALAAWNADLMVVAAYGLILPPAVLAAPRFGCLNIHASLLPRWRGAAPIHRALLAGDDETGITVMQMDAGLDTGGMLLKQRCPIAPDDTGQSLHDKLAALGAHSIVKALAQLPDLKPEKQDETAACYAHKLQKTEALLDWQQPARVLARQIRAFNPWPVAQTALNGLTFRLWQAKALAENSGQAAGKLVRADKTGLYVQTGEGVLCIQRLQQASGKVISISDFLNAHQIGK
jgi:methionyl-tRNA formyltransferase